MCAGSVAQLCRTLCNCMDCSPPGSSARGISQLRILVWVAISSSRGSSRPTDWTHVSCIGRWILYHWTTWEIHWGKSSSSYLPCHTFNSSNRFFYMHAHTHTHTRNKTWLCFKRVFTVQRNMNKAFKGKKIHGDFQVSPQSSQLKLWGRGPGLYIACPPPPTCRASRGSIQLADT